MLGIEIQDDSSRAALSGQLVFSENLAFRQAASRMIASKRKQLVLDLLNLDFIDSAGLGMLLLLREEAMRNQQEVVLSNAQSQVKRMLEISRFETLFRLQS